MLPGGVYNGAFEALSLHILQRPSSSQITGTYRIISIMDNTSHHQKPLRLLIHGARMEAADAAPAPLLPNELHRIARVCVFTYMHACAWRVWYPNAVWCLIQQDQRRVQLEEAHNKRHDTRRTFKTTGAPHHQTVWVKTEKYPKITSQHAFGSQFVFTTGFIDFKAVMHTIRRQCAHLIAH